jgi:hypothetical protein
VTYYESKLVLSSQELFLSKAERDYLPSNEEINHDYVWVKSRLHKKLREFNRQELPLLVENGLVDIAEIRKIAEYCNNNNDGRGALVAQPGRELPLIESENKKGALAGIRARDLYLSGGGSPPKKDFYPYQGNALPG